MNIGWFPGGHHHRRRMAAEHGLTNQIECDASLKEEPLGIVDCLVDGSLHHTKNELMPAFTEDLMNLCDNYNLYLINEEIVYTEPLDYESPVNVNSPLLEEDLFADENDVIIDNKDLLNGNDYQSVIDSLTNTNIDPFCCTICHRSFGDKFELNEHHKIHEIWSCNSCKASFNSQTKLRKHITKQHDIQSSSSTSGDYHTLKLYACHYCCMQFARSSALISHERIHRNTDNLTTCNKCSMSFVKGDEFNIHLQECEPIVEATLQPLQKKNRRKKRSALQRTVLDAKKPISYKIPCPECNKMFQTRQKMQRHNWIHRKKAFSCEVCAMSFLLQAELDSHRLSEHAEQKKYMCTECGKSFASRQGLWEHNRLHDESKTVPYTCTECTKTFTSRSGIVIHMRTHSGEKPFVCSFCEKPFRDGGTLRKHLRIHTGSRPHKCPLCEKSFNQKVVMREHIRWVHASNCLEYPDPAPYTCWLCSSQAPLMDREELCVHIVKHSDQIASIMKLNEKLKKPLDFDAEPATTIQLPNDTESAQADGIKCDPHVIQKNRRILGYIDQLNDRHTGDVKAISFELENSVCL